MRNLTFSCCLIALVAIGASCKREVPYFEENKSTEGGWYHKDTVVFNVNIDDTLHKYNIFLNVRNTRDYPYNNFFIKVLSIAPDGKIMKDVAEVPLADEASGKWNGSGSSGIYSNSFLYKYDRRFPVAGEYKFILQQAMRYEPVNEVIDVGLKIERARKK